MYSSAVSLILKVLYLIYKRLTIDSNIKKELFSYLKNDMNILEISFKFNKMKDSLELDGTDETIKHMLFISEKIFTDAPPVHYNTCSLLSERMNYLGANEEFLLEIEKKRVDLIKETRSSGISENHLVESDNWIF